MRHSMQTSKCTAFADVPRTQWKISVLGTVISELTPTLASTFFTVCHIQLKIRIVLWIPSDEGYKKKQGEIKMVSSLQNIKSFLNNCCTTVVSIPSLYTDVWKCNDWNIIRAFIANGRSETYDRCKFTQTSVFGRTFTNAVHKTRLSD